MADTGNDIQIFYSHFISEVGPDTLRSVQVSSLSHALDYRETFLPFAAYSPQPNVDKYRGKLSTSLDLADLHLTPWGRGASGRALLIRMETTGTASSDGHKNTLGGLRLRNKNTNEIILIPTPTNDPNDPLSWSKPYRVYIAVLVSCAIFFSNFLAAGPTVAILSTTEYFFGPPGLDFNAKVAQIAYLYTTTALLQGMGNVIWMPLISKYGRRPIYVVSFTLYTCVSAWAGSATSYSSALAVLPLTV
ncbi:hypothetical protein FZEAL_10271 [Fusarium zealandicum]|uniref:Major facilitator superfamily (MFS) profile domain-containing protein n=1 Tax=Fusarium zealandicum TaxID=1053134 RepID=A0A8H4U495_9HYPO|nr:hypothetical protein FZEAL_10271 [Fusarium zealandicum]